MQQDHQSRHNCNDAEAADLDQGEDHDLTEHAPCGYGRQCDQSSHTGGGCRGKQGVKTAYCISVRRTDRKRKQQTANQDHSEKAQHDDLSCGKSEHDTFFHNRSFTAIE